MRQQSTALLTIGGMLAVVVALMFTSQTLLGLDAKLSTLIDPANIRHPPPPIGNPMSISQDVTNTKGQTATITTVRQQDGEGNWLETIDEWLGRHAAAVAAYQAT